MDRTDYYRVLGVQPGATGAQIDSAYRERMKRLKSPDYADEKEYAERKMRELKQAYSIVCGGAAPDSNRAILDGDGEKIRKKLLQHPEGSHSHKNDRSKKTMINKPMDIQAKKTAIAVIVALMAIFPTLIRACAMY